MEKIASELKLCELKHNDLRKACETMHSQASSILTLTIQCNELDEHFDTTQNLIECRFKELKECAKEIRSEEEKLVSERKLLKDRNRDLSAKESELESLQCKIRLKEEQLNLTQNLVEEFSKELESKKEQLEECCKKIRLKEEQLGLVENSIKKYSGDLVTVDQILKDRNEELVLKEEVLCGVVKLIAECEMELESKGKQYDKIGELIKERFKELNLKEIELEAVQKSIKECSEEINSKKIILNGQLNLTRNSVEECSKELESKKEQLSLVQESLEECCKKIKLKEEQLGLVENSIKKYSRDLVSVDKRLNDCTGQLVLKEEELYEVVMSIEECKMDLEFKGKQYDKIGELIKERSKELNLKKSELEVVQKSIKECSDEINSKKNILNDQLNLMRNSVEECSKELESKKEQLDLVQKSLDECCKKIKLKEEQLGLATMDQRLKDRNAQLVLKEEELCRVVKLIEERQMELELKERHDDSIKLLIQENSEELKLKENKYDEIGKLIKERLKELNLKENELEVAQKSIKECSEEIKSKQNILNSIEKSMDKKTKEFNELQSKRKQEVDSMQAMLKKYSEDIELNVNKIKAIQKSIAGQNKELEVKKNQLKSTQKLIEECGKDLKLKEEQRSAILKTIEERERQCEERVKELQSKEKQLLIQKSVQEGIKNKEFKGKTTTLPSQVKTEQLEFTPANNVIVPYSTTKSCVTSEGRNLLLLLNEHLKMHDMVRGNVLTVLETSVDPAKLVIEEIIRFYPSHSEEGDMEFDSTIIRSCILLLEHLVRASPVVKPQVRDEARRLAVKWKAKMKVGNDNSLEVLGFLQLIATYGLGTAFSEDELCSLLDTIDQNRKAPELRHALGINKTPVSSIHTQIKVEKPDYLSAENANGGSYANLTSSCTPARSMQWFRDEQCNGPDLTSSGISDLEMSLDPAKLVLDELHKSLAQNRKKGDIGFGETVMKSYILRLEKLVKVSPQISSEAKEEATKLAVDWKVKIRASTENYLEVFGFLLFLATYGLVSSFNLDEILELFKVVAHHEQGLELCQKLGLADKISNSRRSVPSPALNVVQQPVGRKRSTSDSPKHQAEEKSRMKLPRTSVSAIRPDRLPVFTRFHSLMSLSPWQYGTNTTNAVVINAWAQGANLGSDGQRIDRKH